MNPLEKYFRRNSKRLIHKWVHYFEIYDRHFSRFRGKNIVVVEFGVSHGGSLQMWRKYFGRRAWIYGVDIDPRCKNFEGSYSFLKEWGRVKCGGRTVCDRFFWVSGVGADKRR
jgi:hypothetical protein